jgi:hypothetical protein
VWRRLVVFVAVVLKLTALWWGGCRLRDLGVSIVIATEVCTAAVICIVVGRAMRGIGLNADPLVVVMRA